MKREDFKQIIRIRSLWTVDGGVRGDRKLPDGTMLSDYIAKLVSEQMGLDGLGIDRSGDMKFIRYKDTYSTHCELYGNTNKVIEESNDLEQDRRLYQLIFEITEGK